MGRAGGLSGTAGKMDGVDSELAKSKKKKKKKKKPVEMEDPTFRDHLLAGAYGGVAR